MQMAHGVLSRIASTEFGDSYRCEPTVEVVNDEVRDPGLAALTDEVEMLLLAPPPHVLER
jgi:hypothetical protein